MRLGVLSDIHGNLPALRRVLELLASERVTRYLCAGDLVGYGPWPNECIDVVRGLGAVCVAGNHDMIVAGRLDDANIGPLARATLQWTASALDASSRAYLSGLPLEARSSGVLLTHGAIGDPRERVQTVAQAQRQLETMQAMDPTLRTLVLGHTHRPFAYGEHRGIVLAARKGSIRFPATERHLVNPGQVGQARERRVLAQCVVLDLTEGRARFHAVPYDVAACERYLRRQGLPPGTYHHKPPPLHRRARRFVRHRILRTERRI
jgi:predicted phosphodiesterase